MDEPRPRLSERAKAFYHEHEPACTVAFFVAGFLFDTMAVGRIDELKGIIQQAVYLVLCALFTSYELREQYGDFAPPERFKTIWRYHAAATHFMLGTLLNIYTLFYFKSASLGTSFLFLLFLAGLLAVNELKPFEGSGTSLRISLVSLCLVSYFTYLVSDRGRRDRQPAAVPRNARGVHGSLRRGASPGGFAAASRTRACWSRTCSRRSPPWRSASPRCTSRRSSRRSRCRCPRSASITT